MSRYCPDCGRIEIEEGCPNARCSLFCGRETNPLPWVSVKERLPKEAENGSSDVCPVYGVDEEGKRFYDWCCYCHEAEFWFYAESGEETTPEFTVTHFLELTPPEEEK